LGKEKEQEMYCGGTIYVDHASGYMYVQNQVSLGAEETPRGKHNFEREAHSNGVAIFSYRADQGVYKTKEFLKDIEIRHQFIDFSGVQGQ
jgi:hypothetical protein